MAKGNQTDKTSVTFECEIRKILILRNYAKSLGLTRKRHGSNEVEGDLSKILSMAVDDVINNLPEFEKRRSLKAMEALRLTK